MSALPRPGRVSGAAFAYRYAGQDLVDVAPAPGPGGFAAGPAGDCSTHGRSFASGVAGVVEGGRLSVVGFQNKAGTDRAAV